MLHYLFSTTQKNYVVTNGIFLNEDVIFDERILQIGAKIRYTIDRKTIESRTTKELTLPVKSEKDQRT